MLRFDPAGLCFGLVRSCSGSVRLCFGLARLCSGSVRLVLVVQELGWLDIIAFAR